MAGKVSTLLLLITKIRFLVWSGTGEGTFGGCMCVASMVAGCLCWLMAGKVSTLVLLISKDMFLVVVRVQDVFG
jgi:hypothetical protein